MSATSGLRDDHLAIMRLVDALKAVTCREDAGGAKAHCALRQAEELLDAFLGHHEHKEEQLLFPAVMGSGAPLVFGVMGRLMSEHGQRRMERERIARAIAEGPTERLSATVEGYADLIRRHIELEERECFDIADRALFPETQRALTEEFAAAEERWLDEVRRASLEQLIARIGSPTHPTGASR